MPSNVFLSLDTTLRDFRDVLLSEMDTNGPSLFTHLSARWGRRR